MEPNEVKVICMVLLFLVTVLFGWPPYFLVRTSSEQSIKFSKTRKKIISYLTCFSGGVFLGASLLHLLPEGMEKVKDYIEKTGANVPIPLYETMIAGGFFLIALVEQLAHRLVHKSGHAHTHSPEELGHSRNNHAQQPRRPEELLNFAERTTQERENGSIPSSRCSYSIERPALTEIDINRKDPDFQRVGDLHARKNGNCVSAHRVTDNHDNHNSEAVSMNGQEEQSDTEPEPSHDIEMVRALQTQGGNPFRAILLLIALSFHTIFDGLAVGLASKVSNVWQMFGAICIHKSLVALCLGTELFLVNSKKPWRAFLTIFVFALIPPIGVGLGMIVSSNSVNETAQTLTNGLLQGVATGTFFYVTFFEILREELVDKGGLLRLCLVVVGFGGMTAAKLMHGCD